ncbi:MAG: hypothetical protein KBT03_09745 [Bacteroidales bacterium]|nr:hypothetical protein [Candidatus Scybalousia scybalohippi]
MKRGDFVVYAVGSDVLFGRISNVQGSCLTIIPVNKDKHTTIKKTKDNVISVETLEERLRRLNSIS